MPWVWVSIGSNIEREQNVRASIDALREAFGRLVLSPVYETPAEGFDGDPFYNLVAGFATDLTPEQLHAALRDIENRNGRARGAEKFSARTLDIDALTYGNAQVDAAGKQLPRDEIERYAFVLKPLADVAPDEIHPPSGKTYRQLWESFDQSSEAMQVVPMDF